VFAAFRLSSRDHLVYVALPSANRFPVTVRAILPEVPLALVVISIAFRWSRW